MFTSPESEERLADFCEPGRSCRRLACFQARVEVFSGHQLVRRQMNACASHIVDAVQELSAWARAQADTGWLEVLAIDPYAAAQPAGPGDHAWRPGYGFAFYAEPLDQSSESASLAHGSRRACAPRPIVTPPSRSVSSA
jgi:hypothetical protein